eukprot:TRINITY_DN13936_c0_g1_i1.p1 TRINITY_DN13936_c0_g1~~TRINITY_DN13936_c0_g1_i1.p1  ORF type:complete len:696 (+),score=165.11 TRINITY_DN13936_c0_g1_i1:159-2090(+)
MAVSPQPLSTSPVPVAHVEVQKDVSSRTWYVGHVQNVIGNDKLLIGFEGEIWPAQEFPVSRVRKPPKNSAALIESFNPKVGDEVEFRVTASEHAPASWSSAVVKKIKHTCYFVSRPSSLGKADSAGNEAIVEKDMLRPPGKTEMLQATGLKQEIFKLPPSLHGWSMTSDAAGCFSHIEEQSGLIQVVAEETQLRLVGDAKAITRAQMLLEIHKKHQTQIQHFQDVRERRLKALETKRNRIEGTGFKHSVEVHIHPSFIPRIIGKSGETIRAVEEKYEVNIRILEGPDSQDEERTIRIFGNNLESLEKARAEVEYVEEAIPLDSPQMRSWVNGRGGRIIQEFRDTSGLVYARVDRSGNMLLVCGKRQAVDDAVAMFETHMMYCPVFHQMEEEMEKIISDLEEYGDKKSRWEWNAYRDQENEEEQPKAKGKGKQGRGEKGKGGPAPVPVGGGGKFGGTKGAKANGKGKAEAWSWDEERPPPRRRKAGAKVAEEQQSWAHEQNSQEWAAWQQDSQDDYEKDVSKDEAGHEQGKGPRQQKGANKGGGGGARHWVAKEKTRKPEDEEEAVEETKDEELEADQQEEENNPNGRGRGRGPGGRGRGRSSSSTQAASGEQGAEVEDASRAVERPERPALGVRKMGKKGLRS